MVILLLGRGKVEAEQLAFATGRKVYGIDRRVGGEARLLHMSY